MPVTNIYALCDPNERFPRYVGQTTLSLGSRLSAHVSRTKSGTSNAALLQWIKGLQANEQRPTIVLLEKSTPNDAREAERAWIALCIEKGCDLLNATSLPQPPAPEPNKRFSVLTKDNTKMLAVEPDTHKQAKQLAAQMGLPLYRVAAIAFATLEATRAAQRQDGQP